MTDEKPETFGGMRRFRLDDAAGCYAQGVVFSSGAVAVSMLKPEGAPVTLYPNLEEMAGVIAGFGGIIRFEDPVCFACASTVEVSAYCRWCDACGAGQGPQPFNERRANPALGTWRPALTIHPRE